MSYSSLPQRADGSQGRILVVEDDPDIQAIVTSYLEAEGFEVVCVGDGLAALEQARGGVELIVLDLGLPKLDGLEVTRRIRDLSPVPILIVSARGEGADRVTGLELGADDYLTKPFLPRELVARVRALLRRTRRVAAPLEKLPALQVDLEARRVFQDGQPVDLTPREYDLLKTLAGAPGKNFTREELLDRVWGGEYVGETRRVDLYISKLRAKLERPGVPGPIRSVWGVGYRFEP